jgi:N12 class adenine-specific DNA methylase
VVSHDRPGIGAVAFFEFTKIASNEWDGIIVTHSSFERIGMSRDYQEKFLREQIAEYDELLRDHAADRGSNRNLIKSIEKQKAAREERLKDLLAQDKKDDGLVFDELGVDHVFIDEAHYFKNLETPTKMERVAGIQTGGSERAFDVYMKARYLHEQHAGHGVTFATGTPISNTMVEMYTIPARSTGVLLCIATFCCSSQARWHSAAGHRPSARSQASRRSANVSKTSRPKTFWEERSLCREWAAPKSWCSPSWAPSARW